MKIRSRIQKIADIAKLVGSYALENQSKAVISVRKGDNDFTTDIDLQCERLIIEKLSEIQPSYPIYAEEENIKPDNPVYWVVDPIDGTKNYQKGLPLWSVNIALFSKKEKEILCGLVYFPRMEDMFWAFKSGGAYQDGKKIKPSSQTDLHNAVAVVELPNNKSSEGNHKKFGELLKTTYRVRGWEIASSICYVANGAFDFYCDFSQSTKPFDIYAPIIIAQEAGCTITNFDAFDINKNIVTVTNGKLSNLELDK